MAVKQNLGQSQQQKQIQKLAMTQSLQQSIQILQYNVEELQSFLKQKELENPLITVSVADRSTSQSSSQLGTQENFLEQVAGTSDQSLFDYLLEQVHLTMRETPLRGLVLFLLDYVDQNGYLGLTNKEVEDKTGADSVAVLDAITLLQQLDPPGVGARDLRECLMLQTENDSQSPAMAYLVLEEMFNQLVDRKWDVICRKLDLTMKDVQEIFDYIRTLTPTPGAAFNTEAPAYVIPDLIVEVENNQIHITQSKSAKPQVHFQKRYFNQLLTQESQEVTDYVNEKKREFEWISKSLQQREDTILRVGRVIVEVQEDYFLHPGSNLKPLMLKDVARKLHLHESTISRSVNGKYMITPNGTFELKHFFSNAVGNDETSDGTQESADSVKSKIKKIINAEDKTKPISDAKIALTLSKDEINISRRTVAKYRESLGIASSSKRKRFG